MRRSMPEALDSIPAGRREHPLSVHGVVLFPAAPGASVIHVDAAEYVEWLQERVSTLRSQLTLCRASLPPELQSAIDALNIGEGNLVPPSTITPVSSGRETADRTPMPSAFVPIDAAPDHRNNHVFKPFVDEHNHSNHSLEHAPKGMPPKKVPFLKRMFDRTSSASKLANENSSNVNNNNIATASVINNNHANHSSSMNDDASSSPDRPRHSVAKDDDESPKRPRRRRSISLDNFGLGGRRDSRASATLASRPRGSFGVDSNGPFRVAYPVAQRAQSAQGKPILHPTVTKQFSHGDAEDDGSISAEHVDDDDYYSGDEVVETNSDCGSIDPGIAAAASCGPKDFEPYENEESIDSMSEKELDYIHQQNSPKNFRALSDGAALTQMHTGGERQRQPSQNVRTVVSPFTSSATSASVDSTDRSAAAEALAKRTSTRASFSAAGSAKEPVSSGPRRSFSMDAHQFPRRAAEEDVKQSGFHGLGAALLRSRPSLSMSERERPTEMERQPMTDRERSSVQNAEERMNVVIDGGAPNGFGFGRSSRRTSVAREGGVPANRRMDSAIKRLTRRRPTMTRVLSHPEQQTETEDVMVGDEYVKRSTSGGNPTLDRTQQPRFQGRISIGGKIGTRELHGPGRKLKIAGLFRRKTET